MRTNRGANRGSTGSGSGMERDGAGVAERTQMLDLKRAGQADCLASLHPRVFMPPPTYTSLAHVLPFILRPTLMTKILLTDATIDP
jgi:hypothetical protein